MVSHRNRACTTTTRVVTPSLHSSNVYFISPCFHPSRPSVQVAMKRRGGEGMVAIISIQTPLVLFSSLSPSPICFGKLARIFSWPLYTGIFPSKMSGKKKQEDAFMNIVQTDIHRAMRNETRGRGAFFFFFLFLFGLLFFFRCFFFAFFMVMCISAVFMAAEE
ncbi:hypothetical protein GGS21DRAFT_118741 [Xylaria nigripes]|nr:hypothetical protein GGS21DRAFT_118741 [Xylaria nigripes]